MSLARAKEFVLPECIECNESINAWIITGIYFQFLSISISGQFFSLQRTNATNACEYPKLNGTAGAPVDQDLGGQCKGNASAMQGAPAMQGHWQQSRAVGPVAGGVP